MNLFDSYGVNYESGQDEVVPPEHSEGYYQVYVEIREDLSDGFDDGEQWVEWLEYDGEQWLYQDEKMIVVGLVSDLEDTTGFSERVDRATMLAALNHLMEKRGI